MAVPKLRFKADDGGDYTSWKNVQLGDVADRVTRKNKNNETDIPLTISSLDGLVDQRTYFGKTIASRDMSGYFLLKNGEFAYNKSYSVGFDYGSIKRLDKYDQGALSSLYICFALKDEKNSDFMTCYFNSLVWNKEMPMICAEGARNHGLLNVSPTDFFTISINMPTSFEEQQKIASFFYDLDEVIAKSEAEVAAWEKRKKGVMQKIFSQEVRFKKDDGSDYPDWEETAFDDVCEGFDYGMGAAAVTYDGMNKYIRITDIDEESHRYLTTDVVSPNGALEDKYLVRNKDILLARTGASVGKSYLYSPQDGKMYFAGFLIRMHVKDDYNEYFVYAQTLTLDYRKWVKITSQRSGQPGINANEYSKYSFKIPCLEEQQKIADCLSALDDVINQCRAELEKWKLLKKGLLQQMFV